MRRAKAAAIVSVKELVKQQVVAEVGVVLKLVVVPEAGSRPVGSREKQTTQPHRQLVGDAERILGLEQEGILKQNAAGRYMLRAVFR